MVRYTAPLFYANKRLLGSVNGSCSRRTPRPYDGKTQIRGAGYAPGHGFFVRFMPRERMCNVIFIKWKLVGMPICETGAVVIRSLNTCYVLRPPVVNVPRRTAACIGPNGLNRCSPFTERDDRLLEKYRNQLFGPFCTLCTAGTEYEGNAACYSSYPKLRRTSFVAPFYLIATAEVLATYSSQCGYQMIVLVVAVLSTCHLYGSSIAALNSCLTSCYTQSCMHQLFVSFWPLILRC